MLNVRIEKLEQTGIHCNGPNCKKLPEYMWNVLGHVYYIKKDTPVAIVEMSGKTHIYCRDCIDDLWTYLKSNLDTKLWAFH